MKGFHLPIVELIQNRIPISCMIFRGGEEESKYMGSEI